MTIIYDDAKIWIDGYDFSSQMTATAIEYGSEAQDDTTFGDTTRSNTGGLKTVAVSHEGNWDSSPDNIFFQNIGVSDVPVSISPDVGADGDLAFTLLSQYSAYAPGGAVGEIYKFSFNGVATGDLVRGTIMHNASRSSSGNGTARQLGAVSATQKVYAVMHVLTAPDSPVGTLDVIIQSDDNVGMTTPTSRITFTQATTIGSEWSIPVDGAITDDYWRVNYTVSGTFSFVVVIAIQ